MKALIWSGEARPGSCYGMHYQFIDEVCKPLGIPYTQLTPRSATSCPTAGEILAAVPGHDIFVMMGHMSITSFKCKYYRPLLYARELAAAMDRPLVFAFLNGCHAMDSLTYRTGWPYMLTQNGGVVVGFKRYPSIGYIDEEPWYMALWRELARGESVGDAFDYASARHPEIAPYVDIAGDRDIVLGQGEPEPIPEPEPEPTPEPTPEPYEIPTVAEIEEFLESKVDWTSIALQIYAWLEIRKIGA